MELEKALYKANRNKQWKERLFEEDEWDRKFKEKQKNDEQKR